MKRFALIFSLFCLPFFLGAQTLEFNQAIYIKLTGTLSSTTGTVLATQNSTVPAGKVWKVVSSNGQVQGNPGTLDGPSCTTSWVMVKMDGVGLSFTSDASSENYNPSLPVWLPPGNVTFTLEGDQTCTTAQGFNGYVSIIEFNVVP
ncbi:MAG: hypothetical protein H6581_27370 [Bacteroidia bacterium]|nr:hypothetical protein [Bacteroidia bacterium]